MLNLDAYSVRDIHIFLQLCQAFEVEGVSDLRFVRERLNNQAGKNSMLFKEPYSSVSGKGIKHKKLKKKPVCLNCGNPTKLFVVDGMLIQQCSKCRWSAIVEEKS